MDESNQEKIRLYTSNFCAHAWWAEELLHRHEIPVEVINIDEVAGARQQLRDLNGGYASVPTLIFPDGQRLVEPSLRVLKQKLRIKEEGSLDKIFGRLL